MVRSIPPLPETPNWQAATDHDQREAAAVWVRLGRAETGSEHVAILAADGRLLLSGTSGLGRVRIPLFEISVDAVWGLHRISPLFAR